MFGLPTHFPTQVKYLKSTANIQVLNNLAKDIIGKTMIAGSFMRIKYKREYLFEGVFLSKGE